jgi:hypothetical protein
MRVWLLIWSDILSDNTTFLIFQSYDGGLAHIPTGMPQVGPHLWSDGVAKYQLLNVEVLP